MGKDWNYGNHLDDYPVTLATLWSAGPHLFACGDLTVPRHYGSLLNPARLTAIRIPLVYVDPPWNQALLTGFRTKAKSPSSELTFTEFIYTLLEPLSTLCPQPVILMEGSAQPKAMDEVAEAVGRIPDLSVLHVWTITYNKGKPAILYQLSGGDSTTVANFHDMDDWDTPALAIEHYTEPGNFVLDPCLGLGRTAHCCQTLSRRCIGMELNPARLAHTLDTLHREHDLTVEYGGTLIQTTSAPSLVVPDRPRDVH